MLIKTKANFLNFIITISLITLIILGIIPGMASALDRHSHFGNSDDVNSDDENSNDENLNDENLNDENL